MLHIHRLPLIFTIFGIGLSACATAAPLPTATPLPSETFTPIEIPPTPTETLTPAPKETATPTETPEPAVVKKDTVFKLTDGTDLTLTCFFKENGATDKQILETVLQYFAPHADWGDGNYTIEGSEESSEWGRRLNLIPGKESMGGWFPVRSSNGPFEDFFGINVNKIPYKDKVLSLITVRVTDKSFPRDRVCADISPEIVRDMIMNQQVDIPQRPITP